MAWIVLHSLVTGKKQRVLWLIVVSISILVPLMIFKTNVSSLDFPMLRAASDSSNVEIETSATSINYSGEIGQLLNVSFDGVTAMVDNQASTLPVKEPDDSTSVKSSIHFHDFNTGIEVPFQWCPSANQTAASIDLDCNSIIAGKKEAIDAAKNWKPPCSYNDEEMARITCDCSQMRKLFHFETEPLSEEEFSYPLAFIMVVEKNMEQIVRLLSGIYHPQNLYCINYDEHSSAVFKNAVQCLTICFENVVTPVRHVEIFWADISILDATMACLKRLVNVHKDHAWKYVQILSWNDLPLKTNLEMVRIFKILNGTADSELSFGQPERFRKFHYQGGLDMTKVGVPRPIPPDGLTMYKGSFAVSMSREFCHYLVTDPVARRLYAYSRPVWAPEEQFWATLIHNPNLNHTASFPGTCLHYYQIENKQKDWISRFQIWNGNKCAGQMVSGSCCFGVGDLPMLVMQTGLVAHKFYADFQPASIYCMLKWHHEKTYNTSVAALYPLNVTYYENLPAVRYQRMVNKTEFLC